MGALEGMRVLDVTQYEAGTSCTQALAWLGADVVKVEPPTGDPGRGGPRANGGYFVFWNSNKRSIAVDLRKPRDSNWFLNGAELRRVRGNYSPGSMERLGLGYDVLKAINPGIIYTRIKGFGLDGPWPTTSVRMVAQASAGAFSITGFPMGRRCGGPTMGDAGTGVQTALAVAAAYVQKLNTGKGQLIEMSMQESMTYYLRTAISHGNYGERASLRTGNGRSPTSRLYKCKGDGPNDYLFLMGTTDPMWERLCEVMDRPDLLEDPRVASKTRARKTPGPDPRRLAPGSARDQVHRHARLCEADVPRALCSTPRTCSRTAPPGAGLCRDRHPALRRIKILGWRPALRKGKCDKACADPGPALARGRAEDLLSLAMTLGACGRWRDPGLLPRARLPPEKFPHGQY